MKLNNKKVRYLKYFSLKHNKKLYWVMKITLFTFGMAVVCSILSQWTAKVSGTILSILLLLLLIGIAIVFDGIGVSVTACKKQDLEKFCRKNNCKSLRIANNLVDNAEKVNNICSDVVGDMSGIISGACGVSIVMNLCAGSLHSYLYSVLLSSLVAAITVGGKAFMKSIALSNSAKMVIATSKLIAWFRPNKKNNRKNINENFTRHKLSSRHKKL